MITAKVTEDRKVNFTLFAGETFRVGLVCKDEAGGMVDLTGYVARCQIRRTLNDAALFSLNAGNGGAIVDSPATSGRVIVFLSDEDTAPLAGIYQVGVKLQSAGGDEIEVAGTLTFEPGRAD